jgi:outer membrane lipoprotein-sorting protein
MRWEYEESGRVLVARQEAMFWYLPEDRQLQILDQQAVDPTQTPTLYLAGEGDLTSDFEVSGVEWGLPRKPGNVQMRLVPRSEEASYQSLVLEVEPDTAQVTRLVVVDLLGNATDFEFDSIRIDVDLADDLFELDVPAGTERVYLGG